MRWKTEEDQCAVSPDCPGGTVAGPAVASAARVPECRRLAPRGREGSGGQARGAGSGRTRTRTGAPGAGRAERPGGGCGRQTARGCRESAGCGMEPPESAAELAAEEVELREPEVRLADPASPGEEHVDVEAADAPGRGRCWPCGAWVCGSSGEPGECEAGEAGGAGGAGGAGRAGFSAHPRDRGPRKFPSVDNPKLVTRAGPRGPVVVRGERSPKGTGRDLGGNRPKTLIIGVN